MITEYIELLESFKKYQISKLIDKINESIVRKVFESSVFTPLIAPYFTQMNAEGVPFTDFDLEPDNITQIKKLINALYHARKAFIGLEEVNLSEITEGYKSLKFLYSDTLHEGYLACHLITHLDINIQELFKEELDVLMPLIQNLQFLSQGKEIALEQIPTLYNNFPSIERIGGFSGIVVDQMKPNSSELDYKFLTEFSALLPGYIEQLTQIIKTYTPELKNVAPKIPQEKINALQNEAFELLINIEGIQGNTLLSSKKLLKCVRIIRNIISIVMSILEQVGYLNETKQEYILYKLQILKYELLPTLFGLVDKIEEHALLKPGILSDPLMQKVKPLYDYLLYYAKKVIDFKKKKYESLQSIEDPEFLKARLDFTYQRIDAANKALFKIYIIQDALDEFYDTLAKPEYNNLAIHQVPPNIKKQLLLVYKFIAPYMKKTHADMHTKLIDSLQGSETYTSWLLTPWRKYWNQLPEDHVTILLKTKESISAILEKEKNTYQLHKDLNLDIIKHVQSTTELKLFPYTEKPDVFHIDESSIFKDSSNSLKFKFDNKDIVLENPNQQIRYEQALNLLMYYKNKRNKFAVAAKAYYEFSELIKTTDYTEEYKITLRNLYNVFQPYLINGVDPKYKKQVILLDKYLVHNFSSKNLILHIPPILNTINSHIQKHFTTIDSMWKKRCDDYRTLAEQKILEETDKLPLVHEKHSDKRIYHIIPHTYFSEFIKNSRELLHKNIIYFNKSTQTKLQGKSSGLPFPELEDPLHFLSQEKQVIGLKQLFNALYHLENIALELESLSDNSSESMYVYHALQAYGHINKIIKISQSLYQDPHFKFLGEEIAKKANLLREQYKEHSAFYQTSHQEVEYNKGSIQLNPLWYVLNAFYIIPEHISSIKNNTNLSNEEVKELHIRAKKANIKIEQMINNSHSYFKLFLQTPNMIALYKELKRKFNHFISTSHHGVMDNLPQIRSSIFTPMLQEADQWEDRLGLMPGVISGHVNQLINEYFKGFLAPLKLEDKTHIQLYCDDSSLKSRIEKNKEDLEIQKVTLKTLESKYEPLVNFYKLFIQNTSIFNSDSHAILHSLIVKSYQDALPLLREHLQHFPVENEYSLAAYNEKTNLKQNILYLCINDSCIEYRLLSPQKKVVAGRIVMDDDIQYQIRSKALIESLYQSLPNILKITNQRGHTIPFDQKIKEDQWIYKLILDPEFHQADIKNLFMLTQRVFHYYKGLKESSILAINTNLEKATYFKKLEKIQEKNKAQFITEYTTDSFREISASFYNKHFGLQYSAKEEYKEKLKNYVLSFEEEIINKATQNEEINNTIKKMLTEKIQQFEKDNFAHYYQLSSIQIALAQFEVYFSQAESDITKKNALYEDEATLRSKSNLIADLKIISEDKTLSVSDRIKQIKTRVEHPLFATKLLDTKNEDHLSFNYLKRCFLALLEALHLYMPKHKKLKHEMEYTVKNPPRLDNLIESFGLFSQKETKTQPQPQGSQPEGSSVQNTYA